MAVLNRREEALEYFRRAVALDSRFAPAHYPLGIAFWLLQDNGQSIEQLRIAAALDPKSPDYRFYLGNTLNSTSNFREALPHPKAATELRPRHSEARNQLCLARQKTGDMPGALAACERAVALDAASLDARNNYGFVLVNKLRCKARSESPMISGARLDSVRSRIDSSRASSFTRPRSSYA